MVKANMASNLEDMYANLVLEDEEDGVIIANEELPLKEQSFVLVGRFLTEKTSILMQCKM